MRKEEVNAFFYRPFVRCPYCDTLTGQAAVKEVETNPASAIGAVFSFTYKWRCNGCGRHIIVTIE